jgi:hypothetical protein
MQVSLRNRDRHQTDTRRRTHTHTHPHKRDHYTHYHHSYRTVGTDARESPDDTHKRDHYTHYHHSYNTGRLRAHNSPPGARPPRSKSCRLVSPVGRCVRVPRLRGGILGDDQRSHSWTASPATEERGRTLSLHCASRPSLPVEKRRRLFGGPSEEGGVRWGRPATGPEFGVRTLVGPATGESQTLRFQVHAHGDCENVQISATIHGPRQHPVMETRQPRIPHGQ